VDFLDSNILVYASDARDKAKQQKCVEIVAAALRNGTATISTQVLFEYANVALTKLNLRPAVVRQQIQIISSLPTIVQSAMLAARAIEIRDIYGIAFWDSAIVAAAEEARCDRILSEDFSGGQPYCGILVHNPL